VAREARRTTEKPDPASRGGGEGMGPPDLGEKRRRRRGERRRRLGFVERRRGAAGSEEARRGEPRRRRRNGARVWELADGRPPQRPQLGLAGQVGRRAHGPVHMPRRAGG